MGNPLSRKATVDENYDLNTIAGGIYDYYVEKGLPSNIPPGLQRGTIIVFNNPYHSLQIIVDSKNFYYRVSGEKWGDWVNLC